MRWFDYLAAGHFAVTIWVHLLILDLFGLILAIGLYYVYETMRKEHINTKNNRGD